MRDSRSVQFPFAIWVSIMKRVSSGSQLSEMTNRPHFGSSSAFGFHAQKKTALHKSSSEDSLQKSHVFVSDVSPPPETVGTSQEVMYAIVSKGLTASECLVDLEELESAPDIHVGNRGFGDLAACMATPVVPDVGNGEIVAGRAAELQAESAKNVTLRYAKEIGNSAANATRRLSRRLSRKRSLDDVQLTTLVDDNDKTSQKIEQKKDLVEIPREAKEILDANLTQCSEKNTLETDKLHA